ncbi:hemicentin-2-like isoform X2 [Dreissena polymorpha]|uniref:hemicentin-2-like isoform X2 n=1 Tax=Dreissena polymorpha TaxID=45954 RepID=UPI0022643BBD|nr:hemicentin-2-like isoform X2 [Dreissena polymorpha]
MAYARFLVQGCIELVIIIAICPKEVNLTSVLMTPNAQTFPKYNEPALYTCTTSSTKPGATIHWFEDVRNITDMSSSTYDSYISTSVLRYLPMAKREANVSCVAMYKYREHHISIMKSTKVFVQFPVSKPTISMYNVNVSDTIIVLEGETVRVQCLSEGFPTPAYAWNFKGHITDGHILELKIKRTENGSALRCSVSNLLLTINGSKTATSYTYWADIVLQVLYKPDKPAVLVKTCNNTSVPLNGSLTLLEGESFEMSCSAHGYPMPAINWIPRLDGYENILRSNRVSYKQRGTYACVAENAMNITATGKIVGRNNVTVFLDIRAPPHPPEQAHVLADSLTENSVKIEWVPSKNGDISETFTLLWKEENIHYWNAITIPSPTTSFYLQGLVPGKKYEVKLTAENIAGKSNGTDIVAFQTDTSAQVASIVGGVVGGCSGLGIMCALTFVIYRKYLVGRNKQPLQSNAYEDITKARSPTMDLESYYTSAGPVSECYEETGFHGRINPTYLKDVPQEQEESYEYVANPKSKKKDVTPTQYDSRIYSN